MKINLGSGIFPQEGWVNVDIFPDYEPDIVINVVEGLPFEDESASTIFAGHLFEHLHFVNEIPLVLAECSRVLRSGGEIAFTGPDILRADPADHDLIHDIEHGGDGGNPAWGDNPHSAHQWYMTEKLLLEVVLKVFPNAVAVPIQNMPEQWPVQERTTALWQCAVVASKA